MLSVTCRADNGRSREPSARSKADRGGAKKAGKTSENRPFCLVQLFHLGTTGVSAFRTGRHGDEDGGLIMLRIRTGARHGLRWGAFGFVAAVFTISSNPTRAAPYADIVIDANNGTVLHSTNPDAQRHPASLTKIMTLYLLFEQLEAGKLKLDSQLNVSAEAAGQMPTKLGLKPGSTLAVEDAIKGMVTRSANDAAAVVAEAIGGDEAQFAKLMTRKAQALGMTRTVYKNASGLPNDDQVTTARDQAILGRAVQERFPRYYKYFSIRTFTFRGQSISNHNHLLGSVEGVDGIKTGYTNASGFNLVTSVHRGNRYLVAVVMGGGSGGSRDARMRELINDKIAQASTKRTTSMVAEAEAPEIKSEAKVAAKPEPKPAPKSEAKVAAKVEPKAESKAEPRFAVASATSLPVRLNTPAPQESSASAAPTPTRTIPGSTEPIRPVLVKTLTFTAGTQTASLAPFQASAPEAQPAQAAAPVPPPPPVAAVKPEPPTPPMVAAVLKVEAPAPSPAPMATATPAATQPAVIAAANQPEAATPPAKPNGSAPDVAAQPSASTASPARTAAAAKPPAPTAKPQHRSGWMIQVGAYPAEQAAQQRLSNVQTKASKMLTGAEAFTEPVEKSGTTFYRARFAGLDKDKAEAACKYLKKNDVECVTIKN
jgi:D-alanyl-D-alanine carboxypeptidase